jgi:hypothetical protein
MLDSPLHQLKFHQEKVEEDAAVLVVVDVVKDVDVVKAVVVEDVVAMEVVDSMTIKLISTIPAPSQRFKSPEEIILHCYVGLKDLSLPLSLPPPLLPSLTLLLMMMLLLLPCCAVTQSSSFLPSLQSNPINLLE